MLLLTWPPWYERLLQPLFWSVEVVIKVVSRWFSTSEGLGFLVLDLKLS